MQVTNTRAYPGKDGDVVHADWSNTHEGFNWRLRIVRPDGSEEVGHWTSYYEGVYRLEGYCIATNYWSGVLPTETPFTITELAQP